MPMIVDAHVHFGADHPDSLRCLDGLDAKLINICVAHKPGSGWREQADRFGRLARESPRRFAWITSFDLPDFRDGYAARQIAQLEQDFAAGAVGCKIWKNVGMEVRTPDGRFLMPDDAVFDPIYAFLAEAGKPLLSHLAEPIGCWQPLGPQNLHDHYYSRNPQWHMYDKPEFPRHEEIMAARDRVLAKHPRLRHVGAHLASLEWDVDEIARRFDAYPNFAVDTSARLRDMAAQPSAKVRAFLLKYDGRVLFGTDVVRGKSHAAMADTDRAAAIRMLEDSVAEYRRYFEQAGKMTIGGLETEGLELPGDCLKRLYVENARSWYPGV